MENNISRRRDRKKEYMMREKVRGVFWIGLTCFEVKRIKVQKGKNGVANHAPQTLAILKILINFITGRLCGLVSKHSLGGLYT